MNPEQLVPAIAILSVFTHELLWLAAIGIFVCGIDDLAVDFLWLWRRAFGGGEALPPPPAAPGEFALFIPAWHEEKVIGPMLARLLQTLDHPCCTVFVGCYPNDPATRRAVAAVADDRVRIVVVARPGPTTKADCLNQLWRAAEAEAARRGRPFKAIVLHDAEDIVHPQSLALYDRLLPGLSMVQLPVQPLPDRRSRWIAGHYLDEFAEAHAKDMVVRDLLGAPVPSAGVGVAIDTRCLRDLARMNGAPFAADSLTEDYELGYRLHQLGYKARMVRHREGGELVATREYFPATLDAAVRQKARWLTGIALSGWDRLGWGGGWRTRWMLLRDRKGLFAAAIAVLAYGAAALVGGLVVLRHLLEQETGLALPPLFADSGALFAAILWFNAAMLCWRLLLRALFVARDNGWREAGRSLPRSLAGNVVNFLAAMRAIDGYRAAVAAGAALSWDKTEHRFPQGDVGGGVSESASGSAVHG